MTKKQLMIVGGVLIIAAIIATLAVHTKPTAPRDQAAAIADSLNTDE